ncbi:Aminoglycoside phosphotransferase [Niveomyces insectorum RCEF 264]|uniref:Aminoglycoside phosphotransferase n=1 Tax=Niveomyces insectorum RCEF 264 TaxID=1081102 RepID=A0A167W4P0_9HYPO|nr:Aminoglycoside phosphotransferase [Niveomyces insectorum RCEF 264]
MTSAADAATEPGEESRHLRTVKAEIAVLESRWPLPSGSVVYFAADYFYENVLIKRTTHRDERGLDLYGKPIVPEYLADRLRNEAAARQFSRRRQQPNVAPDIACSVNVEQFTSGCHHLVLELAFSDNVYWIVRIPHQALDDGGRISMLSEMATLKLVREHTTVPVPQVFGFEMSADQPFGYPYVFMEYLGGRALPNGVAESVPRQHHAKVAGQLANVFAELQNVTFSRIGRLWCGEHVDQPPEIISMAWHASPGPLETSFEYFYAQRQSDNRTIMAMHPNDPDWQTACWVLKTSLAHVIVEDRIRGPFPLCHLDLHFGNMLFDSEFNLTGIIDWSSAQAAPLEQLSVCPEFVTFPGRSEDENRPIVELKKLVVESLRAMEKNQQRRRPPWDDPERSVKENKALTPLSTYMASKSAEITHRHYMASPRGSLWAGKTVAKLVYGKTVTWEQLREVYGTTPLL